MEYLDEIDHAPAPARELSDEDGVDSSVLRQRQNLLPLDALILRPGRGFLPDPSDFIARLFGEGA